MERQSTIWVFVAVMSLSVLAWGQEIDPKLIPKTAEGVDDGKTPGWYPLLRFSGNMALGQSKNSPGTADGVSLQLGYLINGGLDYLSKKKTSEWTNTLSMALSYTRTPVVDAFVKSSDAIDFKSTYLFHPKNLPWLGPFVAFRLSAPMLKGYEVRPEDTEVVRLERTDEQVLDDDGNPVFDGTLYKSGKKIPLTDPFAPLTLRESVGVFAIPLDKPWLKTDFRLGFGAWETFVGDGFVIDDHSDTDFLELRRMQDSVQAGPELGIMLKGAYKDNVTYGASALFMHPVVIDPDNTDLEGTERLNMEFEVGIGMKITKYFSIDYAFKAYKQPMIIEDWQIQNNLLLTIAFEVPSPAPPPPACPACPEVPAPEPAAEPVNGDEAVGTPSGAPADPPVSTDPSEAPVTASGESSDTPAAEGEKSSEDEGTAKSEEDTTSEDAPPATPTEEPTSDT